MNNIVRLMNGDYDDFLLDCLQTYGENAQIRMIVEECCELLFTTMKVYRGKANSDDVDREIADVLILLRQLILLTEGDDIVSETIELKINRQIERLNNGF